MLHIRKALTALTRLLDYPDEYTDQTVELLYVVLQGDSPEAAAGVASFGRFVEEHELWELQEAFTRTFDVNPACALEVGWHLFGEEYARGMFLVRMREEMRRYGLPESVELPDHLSHVLAVVAAMPEEEAGRFVRACVRPAVGKMREALADNDGPYRHLVVCLDLLLACAWEDLPGTERKVELEPLAPGCDPLRAFPVADVGCGGGCSSECGGEVDVVPLQLSPVVDFKPNKNVNSE